MEPLETPRTLARQLSQMTSKLSVYEVQDTFVNGPDAASEVEEEEDAVELRDIENDDKSYIVIENQVFSPLTQTEMKSETRVDHNDNNNKYNMLPHETTETDDISQQTHTKQPVDNNVTIQTVPIHQRSTVEMMVIALGGSALSFNSGLLNGITLQSSSIAVTHVTGTTSNAAINLVTQSYEKLQVTSLLIICFLCGAVVTGYFSPSNSFRLGGQYGPLFIIGSILLYIATLLCIYAPDSYAFFYLAAMSSGLQNGITTKYSGSVIRTTHVTGIVYCI